MSDSFKCLFLALAAIVVWVGQPVSPLAACQAEPARPMVRVTEAFRLSIHTESERVADQAREVAEKTWEIASDVYGATLPNKRLKVLLHRTKADLHCQQDVACFAENDPGYNARFVPSARGWWRCGFRRSFRHLIQVESVGNIAEPRLGRTRFGAAVFRCRVAGQR